MKNFIFLFAILLCAVASGQNDEVYVDELIQGFSKELKERNVTTYYVSKRYCSGKVELFKIGDGICVSKGTYIEAYVVWKEGDTAFFKKIDNCGMYHNITPPDSRLFDLFAANIDALKNESVKKYKSAKYTGEPQLRTTPQPCARKFDFVVDGNTFSKEYNLFDVSNDSDGENLNYAHNEKLKIVQLDAQLGNALALAEPGLRRQKI